MSAGPDTSVPTTKAVVSDKPSSDTTKEQQRPTAPLEEDDEFEDFPVEGMFNLATTSRLAVEEGN